MGSRLDLQKDLEELMEGHMVKFQPPPSFRLSYPCCVFSLSNGKTKFASNYPYLYKKKYMVTIITQDADSDLVEKMAMRFQTCVHERSYTADNLYHHVFILYY